MEAKTKAPFQCHIAKKKDTKNTSFIRDNFIVQNYLPTPKNIRLPMSKKIFSAYIGLGLESMHLKKIIIFKKNNENNSTT